ncbi:hypothetical protein IRZ71_23285 [Flavobacterium sp. ANB]|nr:hypothetical protein [Flavobacterium sp. ANB]MTD72225.1 hypothetical protein [Flavobacterium sp. LC2016-13]
MNRTHEPTEDQVMNYLSIYMDDSRLSVWHLAILMAILSLGYRQGEEKTIKVSRSKIMALSHINTIPTYHKYFKQLQIFGYIIYRPSYHPGYKSEIELNENRLSQEL